MPTFDQQIVLPTNTKVIFCLAFSLYSFASGTCGQEHICSRGAIRIHYHTGNVRADLQRRRHRIRREKDHRLRQTLDRKSHVQNQLKYQYHIPWRQAGVFRSYDADVRLRWGKKTATAKVIWFLTFCVEKELQFTTKANSTFTASGTIQLGRASVARVRFFFHATTAHVIPSLSWGHENLASRKCQLGSGTRNRLCNFNLDR